MHELVYNGGTVDKYMVLDRKTTPVSTINIDEAGKRSWPYAVMRPAAPFVLGEGAALFNNLEEALAFCKVMNAMKEYQDGTQADRN